MLNPDDLEELLSLYKEHEERQKAEDSFHEFVKQAWHQVEGKRPFIDGWHIQAICEHLEAVTKGQIRYLLINVPPGCCKSTLVSVLWPIWEWIKKPETRFLCASYAASLSIRDSLKARRVIESNWFQSRWGHCFRLIKSTEHKFENDKRGHRSSTSVEGTATGDGGDRLISDDLNNVQDSMSDAIRETTARFWTQVWPTRLRDDKKGALINIQQRTNIGDVTGLILSGEDAVDWVKVILPMEFDPSRRAKTIILSSTKGKVWQDPRKKEGELLWPAFKDKKAVDGLKIQFRRNEYAIAGQLQQQPVPASGGIIKKYWLKPWKNLLPKFIQVIQSWDTALSADEMKTNAYSACTTWGMFYNRDNVPNLMLLNMFRDRLEYPELRKAAIRMYQDYRYDPDNLLKPDNKHIPDIVLVESKASGHFLISDLRRAGINAIGFDPTKHGDKIQRVRLITPLLESGMVWMPAQLPDYLMLEPYAHQTVELCGNFPMQDTRDVVDTMTQVLLRLSNSGWLTHPDDGETVDTSLRPKNLPVWGD